MAAVDPAHEAPEPLGATLVVPQGVVETHIGQPVPVLAVNGCQHRVTYLRRMGVPLLYARP